MEKELVTLISVIVGTFSGIAMTIIAVIGFVMAAREYYKTKKDNTRSLLAKEAYALYFVEQEAIKKIIELKNDVNTKPKTVQKEIRDAAIQNPANTLSLRPKFAANKFSKYIND